MQLVHDDDVHGRFIPQMHEPRLFELSNEAAGVGRRHEPNARKFFVRTKRGIANQMLEGFDAAWEFRRDCRNAHHDRNSFDEYRHKLLAYLGSTRTPANRSFQNLPIAILRLFFQRLSERRDRLMRRKFFQGMRYPEASKRMRAA